MQPLTIRAGGGYANSANGAIGRLPFGPIAVNRVGGEQGETS
jgi:hypothetical protein